MAAEPVSKVDFSKHRAHPRVEWAGRVRSNLHGAWRKCQEAIDKNYPRVHLIGIKMAPMESSETYKHVSEAFRAEIEGDPEIAELLAQVRAHGIEIGWGGYSDPTGEEVTLQVMVKQDTETRLRDWLRSGLGEPLNKLL